MPEQAKTLFEKADTYRRWTVRLELIVGKYNNMMKVLLPVEKPLMYERVKQINKSLQAGFDTLQWNSENIDKFIDTNTTIMGELDFLVEKLKGGVQSMIAVTNLWSETPLFQRKNRTQAPEDVENIHNAMIAARLDIIKGEGKEIHRLVKDLNDNVRPEKTQMPQKQQWPRYLSYINGHIIEGITEGINSSMTYLAEQIDISYNETNDLAPIFDIKVQLEDRVVQFEPSICCNSRENGIRDIINMITGHFYSLAIQIPRID